MTERTIYQPGRSSRVAAVAITLLLEGLIGLLLLTGRSPVLSAASDDLKLFEVRPESRRPKPVVEQASKSHRAEGAASPPNVRSRATEILAPPPLVPSPRTSPVIAAPVAGAGSEASAGAAIAPGPGSGAGGLGSGSGSGGAGDGDGDGDGGDETPPRWRKGRLKDSDYPHGAGEAGLGGTVSVRYRVNVDGRVSDCRVTRSSGNDELDAATCRLIAQRFRFEPSRDAAGRAVPSYIVENHSWAVRTDPTPDP